MKIIEITDHERLEVPGRCSFVLHEGVAVRIIGPGTRGILVGLGRLKTHEHPTWEVLMLDTHSVCDFMLHSIAIDLTRYSGRQAVLYALALVFGSSDAERTTLIEAEGSWRFHTPDGLLPQQPLTHEHYQAIGTVDAAETLPDGSSRRYALLLKMLAHTYLLTEPVT